MFSLEVRNAIKIYKKKRVVNDVSFKITQGEVVGLLGPNGAGKTTSFYMAVGMVKPSQGKVYLNERDVTKLPMYKRARLGIGYLPQENSVFRKMTVENNIKAILQISKYPKKDLDNRCDELLDLFKVGHVRTQLGNTLSGGERRRVEIARALAINPKILLLDEPFAGVDPIAVKDIQEVVKTIKDLNIGVLITDHNVRETLKIVSRAYLMAQGKVFLEGNAQKLTNSKKARKIYLGDDFKL